MISRLIFSKKNRCSHFNLFQIRKKIILKFPAFFFVVEKCGCFLGVSNSPELLGIAFPQSCGSGWSSGWSTNTSPQQEIPQLRAYIQSWVFCSGASKSFEGIVSTSSWRCLANRPIYTWTFHHFGCQMGNHFGGVLINHHVGLNWHPLEGAESKVSTCCWSFKTC